MSSSKNGSTNQQIADEHARIKAVRDLIFGEDMAEYQKEFGRIRQRMDQHKEGAEALLKSESTQLNEKLDAMEHSFNQSLQKLKKEMDDGLDRLESLHNGLVQDRNDLGKALAAIGDTLQK